MKKVLLLAVAALSVDGANAFSTQGGIYQYNFGSVGCQKAIANHKAALAAQLSCAAQATAATKAGRPGFGCAINVPLVPASCLLQK